MNDGKKDEEINVQHMRGFSLVEVLIAMGITLVILAAALGIFKSMSDSSTAANQVYEITVDTQAVLNMIRRDLQRAIDIPGNGIPVLTSDIIAWGDDYCSHEAAMTFECDAGTVIPPVGRNDDSGGRVLDAVTPTTVNSKEAITIIFFDEFARDMDVLVSEFNTLSPVAADAARFSAIRQDDFIFLHNSPGPALLHVTKTDGAANNITLGTSIINQSLALTTGNNVKISLLRRVTYYLNTDANGNAWLMRQVNNRSAERLVPGVDGLELGYNIISAATGVLDLDNEVSTGSFESDPGQMRDIRRVNVDIKLDSKTPVIPGVKRTVQSAQLAKMAVRRLDGTNYCRCNEEWSDALDACVLRGNGGLGCDVDNNEYWDVAQETCLKCEVFQNPTLCGCEMRCTDPDTYWDPYDEECKQWKPAPGCNYTGNCDRMDCALDGCGGNGNGGTFTCTVTFYDPDGNKITTFRAGNKPLPPGITSATTVSGNAYSNGNLQIGPQNNSTFFPAKHKYTINGVTVAFMSYTDGFGDKSPITPIRLSAPPACTGSAIHCPAYYDDSCMGQCRSYFENPNNFDHCNSISGCHAGGVCKK